MNLASELAKSGEAVKAGPIGLAVILILCIACYFLFKSMSKHMKRVREDFPSDAPPTDGSAEATESAEVTEAAETTEPTVTSPPPVEGSAQR